jgi:glycosyltransferase involved in cell wall biosynthesis
MMDELYRAADLMLFPSSQEGFGIPVLEAGAVNLPLFCSDIPPVREVAGSQAEYFGLDESPAAVAARIASFMANDPRYGLRRRVKRHYDWNAIFDRLVVPLLRSISSTAEERPVGAASAAGLRLV